MMLFHWCTVPLFHCFYDFLNIFLAHSWICWQIENMLCCLFSLWTHTCCIQQRTQISSSGIDAITIPISKIDSFFSNKLFHFLMICCKIWKTQSCRLRQNYFIPSRYFSYFLIFFYYFYSFLIKSFKLFYLHKSKLRKYIWHFFYFERKRFIKMSTHWL